MLDKCPKKNKGLEDVVPQPVSVGRHNTMKALFWREDKEYISCWVFVAS